MIADVADDKFIFNPEPCAERLHLLRWHAAQPAQIGSVRVAQAPCTAHSARELFTSGSETPNTTSISAAIPRRLERISSSRRGVTFVLQKPVDHVKRGAKYGMRSTPNSSEA